MRAILKSLTKPKIEFICDPKDRGVMAEPLPAKSVIPEWFRRLPAVDKAHVHATNNGLTIKRCMPFLDAMTAGWIIPLAATVRIEISEGGTKVDCGWDIDRVMVSNHGMHQIAGNPREPKPPCKFHNYWTVKTPPGWSCLFVQPLNRPSPVFEVLSGVVDTDTYQSLINFPFIPIAPDGIYTVERGTPLAQVIPFRRDSTYLAGDIRTETRHEADLRERILRSTQAEEGWYRRVARSVR